MTLKDLAVDHPYYANRSNFYSRDAQFNYDTWASFFEEWGDAEIDMNLVYRFDVYENGDEETSQKLGTYNMQITQIGQRKGIYKVMLIDLVTEDDVPAIVAYLRPYWEQMKQLWQPFSNESSV